MLLCFFFSSRRRHTRLQGDWSSDVCSSDLSLAPSAVWRCEANHATGERLIKPGVRPLYSNTIRVLGGCCWVPAAPPAGALGGGTGTSTLFQRRLSHCPI